MSKNPRPVLLARGAARFDLSITDDVAWARAALGAALTSPTTRGTHFGAYELLEQLGSGATATVYRARHVGLNRIVALKVMHDADLSKGCSRADPRASTEPDVQRFKFGAQAAAELSHPHIAPIYEVGEHDGVPFLTMRLFEGGTLAHALSSLRKDVVSAVSLLAKVASAIQHAHERGVLHRDLKPANIVLDEQSEPFVVDFGFAKHLDERAITSKPSILVGTMGYMAPEQASGDGRSLTFASDIYALGAILYQFLTGELPFQGPSLAEFIERLTGPEPAPSPRAIEPNVDRELEFICLKCLEKNPRRRYASAAELARDLERWLRCEPIEIGSDGNLARLARWCRVHPALATLIAGTISVLAATASVAVEGAREFEQSLLSAALRANAGNAQGRAGQVLYQLRELSLPVARCATDPRIEALFAHGAEPAPAAHADRLLIECGAKTLFDSVALIDRAGSERARLPGRERPMLPAEIVKRDYFLGSQRNAQDGFRWIHVGRVQRSEDGDGGRRLSISAPVFDEDNQWLGIVNVTIAASAFLEALQLGDSGREMALLVGVRELEPGDPPESRAQGVLVLLHKEREETLAAENGSPWHKLLKRVKEEAAGRDPLQLPQGSLDDSPRAAPVTLFGQRWLAAFAPVGDTGLGVVVQTQYEIATEEQWRSLIHLLAWTGGVFSLGALAVLILARTLGRRTRRRV
jgi:serine/threonine protein kinase